LFLKALVWIAYHLESLATVEKYIEKVESELKHRGHEVVICRDPECAAREIEDADIMICWRILPELFAKAKKLRWIQFGSAGIDHTLFPELLQSDVILTNLSGIHQTPVAEHVFGCILAFSRGIHTALRQQISHEWNRRPFAESCFELAGKTVGIIGYGRIGQEIGRIAKCFGMRVIGSKRTAANAEYADEIVTQSDLPKLIKESDFLILVLPLTGDTTALLGEKELHSMKPGAYLINVARGQMVDYEALAKLLRKGRIAGVALDVFSPEPLPPDSELWDIPNCIITPHTAGMTSAYSDRAFAIFKENLNRFETGEGMINVFDRKRGY
jgi:D-2-hydroxyacid dehydrogenase (NADP+)